MLPDDTTYPALTIPDALFTDVLPHVGAHAFAVLVALFRRAALVPQDEWPQRTADIALSVNLHPRVVEPILRSLAERTNLIVRKRGLYAVDAGARTMGVFYWDTEAETRPTKRLSSLPARPPEQSDALQVRAQNKRARALGATGLLSVEEWRALKERYGNKCLSCGESFDEVKSCIDHVMPLSRGGSNRIQNIQALCSRCNTLKGDRVVDWRKLRDQVS